jgi:Ala-tRNA(Pro) deacylase
MSGQLLIEYLQRRGAEYDTYAHEVAYTAPEIAEQSHVQGGSFAKVVMIKADGELAMMVVPAHYHVDLDELADELAVDAVILACEKEFGRRFPRCEIGAMPPFGHLYGLQTYMVNIFPADYPIAFNAGSHSEIITMPLPEFIRLACVEVVTRGAVAPLPDSLDVPRFSSPRRYAQVG